MDTNDKGKERREHTRYPVQELSVDANDGSNFLLAPIENISEMGLFIETREPLPIGTLLDMTIGTDNFHIQGIVVWINPVRKDGTDVNPGMGVRFVNPTDEQYNKVSKLIRTIAFVSNDLPN